MPADSPHHKTKKKGFTFLLVSNDDVAQPRNVRLALWQVLMLLTGSLGLIVALVFVVLIYTPVGTWVRIPNPQLEIRYTQQLVVLNQKMASLMEQLVELRTYNVKLRNALGEEAVATDSGVVVTRRRRDGTDNRPLTEARRVSAPGYGSVSGVATYPLMMQQVTESSRRTSLPAILPTEGYLTRGFIPEQRHFGLDIAGKIGTPVNAAADGYVVFAGWTTDEGYVLILSHADGFLTFYKHNQSLLKTSNTFVRRGEPIALLGNSGRTSSGPHLHFEVWKDGTPVNPESYLLNINL
ncbi:MAG: M23 family metallopeptidase [Ignavibacteriales bacterium]|nr:M23 family metallopeptidase [Ignavibacteriales bacterium]